MFYWLLKRVVLGPLLRAVFRPWVRGLDHVPSSGGAILVSNHLSFSDSVFLPLVVPRRITFLAKADYFTGTGIKGRLTAVFFRSAGQVPVDRSGGQASEAALRAGLKVLARGELLGIYPEGTRSPDGRLYRGKTGVARMALEGHVPVLPVAMVGTDRVQPVGRTIPRIRPVGVVIGAPLDFSRYEGMESDRFVLRSATDEIMYELMRLSGQEYVDVYAATMKEQLAEAVRERIADVRARTERIAHRPGTRAAEKGAAEPGPPVPDPPVLGQPVLRQDGADAEPVPDTEDADGLLTDVDAGPAAPTTTDPDAVPDPDAGGSGRAVAGPSCVRAPGPGSGPAAGSAYGGSRPAPVPADSPQAYGSDDLAAS